MPNRIVRLFLQEAGRQYDANRGYGRFGSMPQSLLARFGGRCAYCGAPTPKAVEEHLVPMNRTSVGLHAWGNIVPSCKPCNDVKSGNTWQSHPQLDDDRHEMIATYVTEFGYAPNVEELRIVIGKLYELADQQTRSLVEFGLIASQPYIAGLHALPAEMQVAD